MLALANVRQWWVGFAAAFVAVAVGVALIAAALLVYDSAQPQVQPRLAASDVLVIPAQARNDSGTLRDRVPWSETEAAALTARLTGVPGVAAVVVDRAFYAQAYRGGRPVADDGAEQAGHGWSSTRLGPYRLTSGREPRGPGEVAVDEALGVAAGATLRLGLSTGPRDLRVSGTLDGPGFHVTDEWAAEQDPGVRAVGLLVAPGAAARDVAERVTAAVGPAASAVTGDDRSALQPEHLSHKRFLGSQLIGATAALSLFVTGLVVASTLALAAAQRRREVALLRIVGATPRQIRRMILGEAATVGVLGAAAGCLLGVLIAPAMAAFLRRLEVADPDLVIVVSAWPLLSAAAIGVGVGLAGAWSAARTAVRVSPVEALRATPTDRRIMTTRQWVAAGSALASGVVLAVLTAATGADDRVGMALAAAMCLVLAAVLLTPVVLGPVARTVIAPLARRSAAATVIRAELDHAPRRAAATAAPIIAAVGFAVLFSGMVETMAAAYPAEQTDRLAGQVIVQPDGTPGLSDAIVRAVPVGRAALPTRLFVDVAGRGMTVIDGVGSRDPRWDIPGEAVVGRTVAGLLGLRAGQSVAVRFVDGRTEQLRISRVLPDDPARGGFVLSREAVRSHDRSALTESIFVPAAAAPAAAVPGTTVHDAVAYALRDYHTDARLTQALAAALIVIAVGYSGLAVANGMATAAHGRRADIAVLQSAGGTVRQVVAFAAGETALVAAIGVLAGMLVPLLPLVGMASGLAQATSTDVGLHLDPVAPVAAGAACVALAVAASVVVTWRTARSR